MNREPSKVEVYRNIRDGSRWRFLEVGTGGLSGLWLMVRVKDGHRLYHKTENLILEREWGID